MSEPRSEHTPLDMPCPACLGTGRQRPKEAGVCGTCGGTGFDLHGEGGVLSPDDDPPKQVMPALPAFCPDCAAVMALHYGEDDCYGAGLRADTLGGLDRLFGLVPTCGQPPSDTDVKPAQIGREARDG